MTGAGQDAFAASRERFGQVTGWLAGEDAAGLTAAELEDHVQDSGRELLARPPGPAGGPGAAPRHGGRLRRRGAAQGRSRAPARPGDGARGGDGDPDRLPGCGRGQPAPCGRRAEPAGGEALARAAQAGGHRVGPRLVRAGGPGDHPCHRDRRGQAAGGAARAAGGRGYRRLLRGPAPRPAGR